jgi:Ran GTPase-activating protein (RanGAP) involved in mRNA processing and transport
VLFINNCLNSRDSIIIIDSFKLHYENLIKLSLSGNNLGLEGSKHLSLILPTMKKLKELRLSGCRVGDKGAASILNGLIELTQLNIVDLSSNQLG